MKTHQLKWAQKSNTSQNKVHEYLQGDTIMISIIIYWSDPVENSDEVTT